MATIEITKLGWVTAPETPQQVTLLIKLRSDPDIESSYWVAGTGIVVLTDGTVYPAYDINGLDLHEQYTVKGVTACGDNSFLQDFEADEGVAAYSLGFSLGFFS